MSRKCTAMRWASLIRRSVLAWMLSMPCIVETRKLIPGTKDATPSTPSREHGRLDFDPLAYAHAHARSREAEKSHEDKEQDLEEEEMMWNSEWYERHHDDPFDGSEDEEDVEWHGFHDDHGAEDWTAAGRLRKLFPKVDQDGDGGVSLDELTHWLEEHRHEILQHRAQEELRWAHREHDKDTKDEGLLTWYQYLDSHGRRENSIAKEDIKLPPEAEILESGDHWLKRSYLLWKWADADGDGMLNSSELQMFLKPQFQNDEEKDDALARIEIAWADSDGDEHISMEEFGDRVYHQLHHGSKDEPVTMEEAFVQADQDKDGILDKSEMMSLVRSRYPSISELAREEAEEMMEDADSDSNGKLSLEEMLDNAYVFYDPVMGLDDYDYDYDYHDEL